MSISKITSFSGNTVNNSQKPSDTKTHFTDKFQTKLKNSTDMSDCITVPRTIFKGYLGIMLGTTLGSLASLMKPSKLKTATASAGILTAMYGTWAFVRPYIVKDAVPTVDLNAKNS